MNETARKKNEIRKEMARRKCAISSHESLTASEQACRLIEQWELFRRAEVVLLYHALPDEFPTELIIDRNYTTKKILLPVVQGNTLELCGYNGKESLCKGCFSIYEPTGTFYKEYAQIDLCFIPGVAFDHKGVRLGRGKGYYDRLLKHIPAPKAGLGYACQYVPDLPSAPHDVRMDYLLTENELFTF